MLNMKEVQNAKHLQMLLIRIVAASLHVMPLRPISIVRFATPRALVFQNTFMDTLYMFL